MAAEDYHYDFYDNCHLSNKEGPHDSECLHGGHAIVRKNSKSGMFFVGCSTFPKCRWTYEANYPMADLEIPFKFRKLFRRAKATQKRKAPTWELHRKAYVGRGWEDDNPYDDLEDEDSKLVWDHIDDDDIPF